MRLVFGIPKFLDSGGGKIIKKNLTGELKIRGLLKWGMSRKTKNETYKKGRGFARPF
jgi:hypothetical protein